MKATLAVRARARARRARALPGAVRERAGRIERRRSGLERGERKRGKMWIEREKEGEGERERTSLSRAMQPSVSRMHGNH